MRVCKIVNTIIYFSYLPIILWIQLIAFNCVIVFLQMVETCFSKFIFWEKKCDRIYRFKPCFFSFLWQLIIVGTDLLSFSNTLMSSSIYSWMHVYLFLSSAKFASSTSINNKNKSFTKILNKMEPNIEPCSTPVIKVFEKHSQCYSFLHHVFCVFRFRKFLLSLDFYLVLYRS